MEENNVKIFWKPVDGGELKELECVAESNGFEFEPLENPIDVQYDPTPVTHSISFDMTLDKTQSKNLRRLFKMRLPRKVKKMCKKIYAKYFGVKLSKVRLNKNYVMYHK